jgi:hypothetical protein
VEDDQDGFIGLDMKTDRDKLQPGQYARAENKRCHRKVVEDRLGIQTPVFANIEPMTILGSGIYSNPNGEEVQLIAIPGEVRVIKSGSYPGSVPIPAGTTLAGAINFAQHFNVILLHREDGGPTLVWDGIAPAFTRLTKLDPLDTSTAVMPDPPWSVNFGYRAWFPTGADTLGASDELDYTSIDLALHNFRINTGEASSIVGVHPFSQNRLIVGNSRSIDVLTGVIGDLAQASMEVLSDEINFAGRRAVGMIGGDLAFLASKPQGIFRITEVIQDQLTANPVPLSDPIEALMERVNWSAAAGAVMQSFGIYLFLFVPIDDAVVPNAALVFNTVSKQWVGVDLYDLDAVFQINNAYVADHFGQKGLYIINHLANLIHVLEQGIDDELGLTFDLSDPDNPTPVHTMFPIAGVFESRGYATLALGPPPYAPRSVTRRDFKRVEIALKTLHPSITVTELMDRASDERALHASPITKSPVKYETFNQNDWNPSNVNNDFDTPGRQDYTLDWTSDFSLPDSGIDLETKQRTPLKFSTKARGQFLSYRVENAQGRADITRILLESEGVSREPRRGG